MIMTNVFCWSWTSKFIVLITPVQTKYIPFSFPRLGNTGPGFFLGIFFKFRCRVVHLKPCEPLGTWQFLEQTPQSMYVLNVRIFASCVYFDVLGWLLYVTASSLVRCLLLLLAKDWLPLLISILRMLHNWHSAHASVYIWPEDCYVMLSATC